MCLCCNINLFTDRLFWSFLDTWRSVLTLPTDVKELTPEFYSADPAFLVNGEHLPFGRRTCGVTSLAMLRFF